ncbi:hypothetical protein D3227_35645 [Mesorhizobium waimense]|uniref:Uncharacterized protein n=1 Tax=Mesorhizobium waimense TaxID=1300307 RepID=A0A3A5K5A2_9HYPH|nr:hypothetical protein [Mesorhizobium waimense]RJT27769.1 hypothetical protein D3227_35645 [Mesorhizobium waimense]
MALKQPKRLPPGLAIYACWLVVTAPDKFERLRKEIDPDLDGRPNDDRRGVDKVRQGYREASIWMMWALGSGVLVGLVVRTLKGQAPLGAASVAICGTAILLWATLAFQGWSIQSFSDTTLTERVNRWLFLYALGTCLLVSAAVWQLT